MIGQNLLCDDSHILHTLIVLADLISEWKKVQCFLLLFFSLTFSLVLRQASLYLYYFLVVVHRGSHGRLVFFLLNVLPSENKDYYYYYYYYYFPDKSVYCKTIFYISHPKHMLWILKTTVSLRRFF